MAVVESNGSEPIAPEALRERLEAACLNTSELVCHHDGRVRTMPIELVPTLPGRPQKPSEYAQWRGKLRRRHPFRIPPSSVVEPQPEFMIRQFASLGTRGSGLGYLFEPRAYQDERSANAA
jgi:hypothetical protein